MLSSAVSLPTVVRDAIATSSVIIAVSLVPGRRRRGGQVAGNLGRHGGTIVDDDEAAVPGEEVFADGGGAGGDAPGRLVDTLAAHLLRVPLAR